MEDFDDLLKIADTLDGLSQPSDPVGLESILHEIRDMMGSIHGRKDDFEAAVWNKLNFPEQYESGELRKKVSALVTSVWILYDYLEGVYKKVL